MNVERLLSVPLSVPTGLPPPSTLAFCALCALCALAARRVRPGEALENVHRAAGFSNLLCLPEE